MSMGVFLRPSRKVKGKSVVDDRGVVIDSQCMAMQWPMHLSRGNHHRCQIISKRPLVYRSNLG